MSTDDAELEALSESVSGRRALDWDAAESAAPDDAGRARVRAWRELSNLAEFHRTLQRGAGDTPGEPLQSWGELQLLERVGAGTGGEVYRAWDPTLQREVALKLLHRGDGRGSLESILAEARALARVRHPGVVAVHGVAEHDGRPGLWMEFLHGTTLESELARRGALPAGEVTMLGLDLARALAAVHEAGVLHRDLKPANVMRTTDARTVLMDFGLGRRESAGESAAPFSGTPLFMSPARLNGAAASSADDLYALGVTLRCALAGVAPFRARTLPELRAEAAAGPGEPLRTACPTAPAALVAAIEHAMHPDPAQRTGSARELADALARPVLVPASGPPNRWRGVTAALAAAALLAVVLVVARANRPATRPGAGSAAALPKPALLTPATTASYDVTASLVRHAHGTRAALEPGDRVGPGDQLSLEFHATRPAWVYVLDADDRGQTYLLFPQPRFDRRNPIGADSAVTLPGTIGGQGNAWTVTSRGGHEHFLIVASPGPVAELETELARLPVASPDRPVDYARIETGTLERLRGVGGVSELAPERAPAPGALFDHFRRLAGHEAGVHGTWVRQVTLDNPLR